MCVKLDFIIDFKLLIYKTALQSSHFLFCLKIRQTLHIRTKLKSSSAVLNDFKKQIRQGQRDRSESKSPFCRGSEFSSLHPYQVLTTACHLTSMESLTLCQLQWRTVLICRYTHIYTNICTYFKQNKYLEKINWKSLRLQL